MRHLSLFGPHLPFQATSCQDSPDNAPQPKMGPPSERVSKRHDLPKGYLDSESASLYNGAHARIFDIPMIQSCSAYAEIRSKNALSRSERYFDAEGKAIQTSKLD